MTAAAAPVTTQLNWVRRARPTPIAMTMYAPYETVANARGPTTRDDSANFGAARRSTSHGDSSVSASATHAVDDGEVREDVGVRPARLAFLLDRVRERRPCHAEGREQQHHRRRDPHADRVEARLGHVGELDEEEAVAEVRHPQEERGRDERDAEAVHLTQQAAVELQPELLAAVAEQREIDDQRPAEVADDDPDRTLLERDDEQEREPDREEDVREACADEGDRALLDAEERGHLLVVDGRPERDAGRAHEVRGVRCPEQERRERICQGEQKDQPERAAAHGEPERRAEHAQAPVVVLHVEVEAEEGARDARTEHQPHHRRQGEERLDLAVVGRRQVARVDGQQEHGDHARHEAADPVDQGVAPEAPELAREPGRGRGALGVGEPGVAGAPVSRSVSPRESSGGRSAGACEGTTAVA